MRIKGFCTVITILILSIQSFAQKSLSGDFIMYNDTDLTISMSEINDHYIFTLTNKNLSEGSNTSKFSIPIVNFDFGVFEKSMNEKIKLIIKDDTSKSDIFSKISDKNSEIRSLYYIFLGIISVKDNLTYEPVAGRLYYNKTVYGYRSNDDVKIKKREISEGYKFMYKKKDTPFFALNKNNAKIKLSMVYNEIAESDIIPIDSGYMYTDIDTLIKSKNRKIAAKEFTYLVKSNNDKKQQIKIEKINEDFKQILKPIKEYKVKLKQNDDRIDVIRADQEKLLTRRTETLMKTDLIKIGKGRLLSELNILYENLNTLTNEYSPIDSTLFKSGFALNDLLKLEDSTYLRTKMTNWEVLIKNNSKVRIETSIRNLKLKLNYANLENDDGNTLFQEFQNDSIKLYNKEKSFLETHNNIRNNLVDKYKEYLNVSLELESVEAVNTKINNDIDVSKNEISKIAKINSDILTELNKYIVEINSKLKEFKTELDKYFIVKMRIDTIQIEINEGYIENMSLTGNSLNSDLLSTDNETAFKNLGIDFSILNSAKRVHFQSRGPIGFSELNNFNSLKSRKLWSYGGEKNRSPKISIKVEDVIEYIPVHQVNRRDYSPGNQRVYLQPNSLDIDGYKDLKKETRKNLFELKMFTDFEGIVNPDKPNGLLQMEVDKILNLRTNRTNKFLQSKDNGSNWSFGYLQFIKPTVVFSKIESENRRLPLKETLKSSYASTLDLKLYQDLLVGYDLNIGLIDIPFIKTTFYLNSGMYFGSTAILDNTSFAAPNSNEYSANTYEIPLKIGTLVRQDENFEFGFSFAHNWLYLRDNRFEQVANGQFFERTGEESKNNRFHYNTFDFIVTYNPHTPQDNKPINSTGRWFFRYGYNWQQGFARTGFSQFQVGHSIPLMSRIKEPFSKGN